MKKYGVNGDICVLKPFVNPTSQSSQDKPHEACKSDSAAHCTCISD